MLPNERKKSTQWSRSRRVSQAAGVGITGRRLWFSATRRPAWIDPARQTRHRSHTRTVNNSHSRAAWGNPPKTIAGARRRSAPSVPLKRIAPIVLHWAPKNIIGAKAVPSNIGALMFVNTFQKSARSALTRYDHLHEHNTGHPWNTPPPVSNPFHRSCVIY